MLRRNMEAVLVRIGCLLSITGLSQQDLELLVPHITKPTVEQKGKNVVLKLPRVDMAAEDIGSLPKMSLQLLKRHPTH
jgi:hypothetical protein